MSELTINCPTCKNEIKLTESLAAPFIESTKKEYAQKLSQKETDFLQRELAIKKEKEEIEKAKENITEEVNAKLNTERATIATNEAKKAREAVADEITKIQAEKEESKEQLKQQSLKLAEAQKNELVLKQERLAIQKEKEEIEKAKENIADEVNAKMKIERAAIALIEAKKAREAMTDEITKIQAEKEESKEQLKQQSLKLAEAQKNEIALRQERQTLQDERANFEVEKQRALDAERSKIRESALKEADEQSKFKIAEKEKTISDLQSKLQDALRKAEQGSQQLQGEVQELELESLLRVRFPRDTIDPVAKGEHGGDVLQRVYGPTGQLCGTIIWESKRTKNWSDGWLTKLREDQRMAKAEMAVIVTQVLPKNVDAFDYMEGVWITDLRCILPVATALRHSLIELSMARQSTEGQKTKMEMVYQYLTGTRFRHRVQAIVERFTEMQSDLDKEKKQMMKSWAKREQQILGVVESTAGMYGDLQGIAGGSFQEIEGLGFPLLEAADADVANKSIMG